MTDEIQIVNVPLKIPLAAIQSGAIELYATAKGWKPILIETNRDEEGNVTRTELPNPVSALDFAIESIQNYVSQDFSGIYQNYLLEQARIKAGNDLVNMGIKK